MKPEGGVGRQEDVREEVRWDEMRKGRSRGGLDGSHLESRVMRKKRKKRRKVRRGNIVERRKQGGVKEVQKEARSRLPEVSDL